MERPAVSPDHPAHPLGEPPRLRSELHLETLGPDRAVLAESSGHHEVSGALFAPLLPLLDGHHTVPELAEALDGLLTPPEVLHALERLAHAGLLAAGPAASLGTGDPLFTDSPEGHAAGAPHPVRVVSLGRVPATALIARLEALGLRTTEDAPDARVIVLLDDYLDGAADRLAAALGARGTAWLPVKPAGLRPWIGPLMGAAPRPCWSCLTARLRAGRGDFAPGARPAPSPSGNGRGAALALEVAARLAARWAADDPLAEVTGRLRTLDTAARRSYAHGVAAVPACPACGAPDPAPPAPPAADTSDAPLTAAGGGYRVVAPARTWDRIRGHVSPLTGIVDELRDAAPDGSGAHVAIAGQNVARRGARQVRARCAGKGTTALEARVGAVCEAIERYSGMCFGDEPRRRDTARGLGARALHPDALTLFSRAQVEARAEWNRAEGDVNHVPGPFDADLEIDWSPVVSLRDGAVRYAPSHLCWYGHRDAVEHDLARADSSGNAAGNHRDEAIVQGFMELVERDAVATWWYPRCRRPAVAIESFDRPALTAMRDHLASLGRRLSVLDLTSDLGIPVFAAVSVPGRGPARDAILGFGAHFDPLIALTRALTELHQFVPRTLRAGPRPRSAWLFDEDRLDETVLVPDDTQPPRVRTDFGAPRHATLRDAVLDCVAHAERAGLEVFVLDQTRAQTGLAVVKVIVPGLRPMWARFAPGRLYDVPVRLGWRAAPPAESALHGAHLYM